MDGARQLRWPCFLDREAGRALTDVGAGCVTGNDGIIAHEGVVQRLTAMSIGAARPPIAVSTRMTPGGATSLRLRVAAGSSDASRKQSITGTEDSP